MKAVTRERFFELVHGRGLNVHPRSERDASYWEFPNRELFGKTTPGYTADGPASFFVTDAEDLP